jgi:hypothetical protein
MSRTAGNAVRESWSSLASRLSGRLVPGKDEQTQTIHARQVGFWPSGHHGQECERRFCMLTKLLNKCENISNEIGGIHVQDML